MRWTIAAILLSLSSITHAGGPPGPWPTPKTSGIGAAEDDTCAKATQMAEKLAQEDAQWHCRWLSAVLTDEYHVSTSDYGRVCYASVFGQFDCR